MKETKKIVLAYLTGSSNIVPDTSLVTHINFAFGLVNSTFDGISVNNAARLKDIAGLKNAKPDLKVLLSLGGWTAGGFSEMASIESRRRAFAESCRALCAEYNLDGIDMDWEYPGSSESGIVSSPEDKDNFTKLMRTIRAALGEGSLLTLASYAGAKFIDFAAIENILDFVNIMVYDVDRPPFLHSALSPSAMTRRWTCESSLKAHIDAGLPCKKIVLGLPFYGHGDSKNLPDFIDYREIIKLKGFTRKWDETARAPYLVDGAGNVVCVYDDEESLREKCKFALEKELAGIMYWEYNCDSEDGALRKTVYNSINC